MFKDLKKLYKALKNNRCSVSGCNNLGKYSYNRGYVSISICEEDNPSFIEKRLAIQYSLSGVPNSNDYTLTIKNLNREETLGFKKLVSEINRKLKLGYLPEAENMAKLLDSECQECIKLYRHDEMRCAFCEEKAYYRDGLIEVGQRWKKQ